MAVISSSGLSDDIHGDLPEDLLAKEILPRLPIESLMRFKCVSKKWLELITGDSILASTHLRHRSKLPHDSIILARKAKPDPERNYRLCWLSKVVELDASYVAKGAMIDIVGSSNGLVCVKYSYDDIYMMLWNPITKELRYLPRAPSVRIDQTNSKTSIRAYASLGFGFDEHGKDYKLVRIVEIYEKNTSLFSDHTALSRSVCVVQVFTTSSDTWREVRRMSGYSYQNTRHVGVLLSGALYWLVETDDIRRYCVLSFNLHDENLRIINLLELGRYNRRQSHDYFRLSKWEESLALLAFTLNREELRRKCNIFVMRNDEIDKQIWTPLFGKFLPYMSSFSGVWRDQLLIFQQHEIMQALYSFNLSGSENYPKLKKVLAPGWRFLDAAHDYVPSLLSVYPNQKDMKR